MLRSALYYVGDANRRMHARDVPSGLGSSASPEMLSPWLTIFREHILGLSPFLLVLYSSKPPGVYLLLLYTLVIFPQSLCLIEAEVRSLLYDLALYLTVLTW